MKFEWLDKVIDLIPKLQKIFVGISVVFIFLFSLYRGITTNYGIVIGGLVGIIGSMFIIGSYALFGMWGIATDNLTDFLSKYPKLRRNIISVFSLLIVMIAYFIVFYSNIEIIFKAILIIFFLIIFPPAIISVIQEERRREIFKLLGNVITPELIAQNPQAAIEHAFTLFEDHLRNHLDVSSSIYGESLINLAFGQDGILSYSDIENENKGVRNLMSGVYATYRNPRKHRIVNDDKETALAIIALIELLIHIIDNSSQKENSKNSQ